VTGAPASWQRLRDATRGLASEVRTALRDHDLLLYGAGVTFYAALAIVPLILLAVRAAAALVGEQTVRQLGSSLAQALPDALGAPSVASALVERGVAVGWLGVALATLPASMYGEGLRRAYAAVADVDDRLLGWKGRLAALPGLVLAPLLLLAVLAVTPVIVRLAGTGAGGVALGVYLALNVDWVVVSLPLAWSYRIVSPDPPSWPVALLGGFVTGAFVAGFLQGFVLFLSLPLDLGAPFGGSVPAGGAAAVLLWLWVLHLVVLVGYVATRHLAARLGSPVRQAAPRR
jgi:membrane protein